MSTTTVTENGEPIGGASQPIDKERRATLAMAAVAGGAGIVAAAVPFVASLMPSERAKAAGAPVQADISGMAPGEMRSFEWQGRPVWILNRTPQMLQSIKKVDGELSDAKSLRPGFPTPEYARNEYRSIKPQYWVAIGICTHLGCSPVDRLAAQPEPFASDWRGGFYCPCHGSLFDLAGRVYKNKPAPDNLAVPPYKFVGDTKLIIGEDTQGA